MYMIKPKNQSQTLGSFASLKKGMKIFRWKMSAKWSFTFKHFKFPPFPLLTQWCKVLEKRARWNEWMIIDRIQLSGLTFSTECSTLLLQSLLDPLPIHDVGEPGIEPLSSAADAKFREMAPNLLPHSKTPLQKVKVQGPCPSRLHRLHRIWDIEDRRCWGQRH